MGRPAAEQNDAEVLCGRSQNKTSVSREGKNHKTRNGKLKNVFLNGTSDHHKILDNLASESRGDRGYVVGR